MIEKEENDNCRKRNIYKINEMTNNDLLKRCVFIAAKMRGTNHGLKKFIQSQFCKNSSIVEFYTIKFRNINSHNKYHNSRNQNTNNINANNNLDGINMCHIRSSGSKCFIVIFSSVSDATAMKNTEIEEFCIFPINTEIMKLIRQSDQCSNSKPKSAPQSKNSNLKKGFQEKIPQVRDRVSMVKINFDSAKFKSRVQPRFSTFQKQGNWDIGRESFGDGKSNTDVKMGTE